MLTEWECHWQCGLSTSVDSLRYRSSTDTIKVVCISSGHIQ